MKNYGLDIARERAEQSDKDWVFGATSLPCLAQIPSAERDAYLPQGEIQRSARTDMMDCASRAPTNILETKFTYLYRKKLISPANLQWLDENGYVKNGTVVFSDAFIAILSGTTREGNSLKAPLEAIRKHGMVPRALLPLGPEMMWEEYHDPAHITSSLLSLGEAFARRFTINYEQAYEKDFTVVLAKDFIDLAGYAWPAPVNGEYPRVEAPPNHAFVGYQLPPYFIFDSYTDPVDGDFVKKLAKDYDFFSYGYRLFIREGERYPTLYERLVALLKRLFRKF